MSGKKMLIIICVLVLINLILMAFLIFGFVKFKNTLDDLTSVESSQTDTATRDVTVIELIADPEAYHGKRIRVIGVASIEFEGTSLSLNKDDLIYGTSNSIWLDIDPRTELYADAEKYDGEYVIIEGIFDKDFSGHMSLYKGTIKDINRFEFWAINILANSLIFKDSDGTYSYTVTDYNGLTLASVNKSEYPHERQFVSTDVFGMSVQTGAGLSARQTTYYDLKNSKVSETFHSVLEAQSGYVIYADYIDEKQYIVVQNIFDKSEYYKAYELSDASYVAADFTADCKLNGNGCAVITYPSGENRTETDITITFP